MGILTLLRNAFGRGRKERPAEAESADQLPTPRQEHDLVAAAFDTPRVPAQQATTRDQAQPTEADQAPPQAEVETPQAEAVTPEADAAERVTPEADVTKSEEETPQAEPVTPEAEVTETEEETPQAEPVTPDANVTKAEEETPQAETVAPKAEVTEAETEAPQAEEAAEPEPLATAEAPAETETAPEAEVEPAPLTLEPSILDVEPSTPEADAEVLVPQQRTEPLPEAEAEADQPAIPEQATEPTADALTPPDPTPEVTAEPTQEATPEATAEPEQAPTPEATAPKATAEPEATAEPAPEVTPEAPAEPEPTPAPEVTAESLAEAEPEQAATPEPTPEPEAADGVTPPQAAPAPDNASRTGGAGGNTIEADGAAEAETTPAPLPSLATAHSAAAATLASTGLTGKKAKLYLVLDRSASMRPYYKDGSAQALGDQTLALAAHLDEDPRVHVVFFSTEVDGTTDLTLTEDHETGIDKAHAGLGRMGRTSYHAAVEAVLAHHDKNHTPEDDVLVVFQTDGAPDAKTPATQALTNAAKTHPKVFFSFVAFGDPENKAFDYLRKLKSANTSFFHAGPTPRELTDTEFYEGVLAAWRP